MSKHNIVEIQPIMVYLIYKHRLIKILINRIVRHGKKSLASRILYHTMNTMKHKTYQNPFNILRQAISYTTPYIIVKSLRKGLSLFKIPIEIKVYKGRTLAIRWILGSARKRLGRSMAFKLCHELIDAARHKGNAIRKREQTHKMAQANKAFAQLR